MIDGSQFVCIDLIALLMKFIIFMAEQPLEWGGGGGGVRGIQTGRSYSEDITNYNSLKVCFTTMTGTL